MRQIKDKGLDALVPDIEDNWLHEKEEERHFTKLIYIGKNTDINEFAECTTAEKEVWETAHQQPGEPEITE